MEYNRLDPFGNERADMHAGIVAATVANAMGRKKGQKAYKAADFMPDFGKRRDRGMTSENMFAYVSMLNQWFGGRVVDKRELNA